MTSSVNHSVQGFAYPAATPTIFRLNYKDSPAMLAIVSGIEAAQAAGFNFDKTKMAATLVVLAGFAALPASLLRKIPLVYDFDAGLFISNAGGDGVTTVYPLGGTALAAAGVAAISYTKTASGHGYLTFVSAATSGLSSAPSAALTTLFASRSGVGLFAVARKNATSLVANAPIIQLSAGVSGANAAKIVAGISIATSSAAGFLATFLRSQNSGNAAALSVPETMSPYPWRSLSMNVNLSPPNLVDGTAVAAFHRLKMDGEQAATVAAGTTTTINWLGDLTVSLGFDPISGGKLAGGTALAGVVLGGMTDTEEAALEALMAPRRIALNAA